MDLSTSAKPPVGRRMKTRAPPPPAAAAPQPAPRRIFRNAVPDGGGSPGGDVKENMPRAAVDLHITLPNGYQTTVTMDGRKALMDVLVELCGQYHLNPAYHTLELLSPDAQTVPFKPNAPLGTLDVTCALIKERVVEERVIRKPPPRVPEKTVRLVVNYLRGQKAVVRVSPLVPLQSLVPVICQKCEFDPAHVLLLRDSISNHELDLRKSLSELEIRELYVLDQTLVLLPKMASAPALNYSAESLRSNTQSSSVSEKKSILGFFKFNRRKSKSGEMFSEDMDEGDDSVMQSTEPCVNGLSVGGGACVEVRPNTLGQSQSAMNLSRLSPKPEPKKRRAPAPPPPPTHTTDATGAEESQTTPGSPRLDSQLRKRKAPPPPATPTPTPTCSTPEPPPTLPVAVVHVPAVHVPAQVPVRRTLPAPALDDSSLSDLSHSVEDSEPTRSVCSSSSSDIAVESATSSLAEEPMDPLTDKRPVILTPVLEPEPEPMPVAASINATKRDNPSSVPKSPSSVKEEEEEEMESPLEFKMEEMENNRHSGIGSSCNVPIKPRRSPLREVRQETSSSPPSSPTPSSTQELPEVLPDIQVDTPPPSWLHPAERRVEQEVETVSMCSSGSFADQGYAASEGMADDSVLLSSPSDMTQPTSLDDSISLGHEPSPSSTPCLAKDCSSDSDEGCATWGSRRSCGESGLQSSRREESYEEDADITAQIHLTLADLDADLAEGNHSDEASVCAEDKIPVSVVDVDIPVTAIDEVPVDDQPSMNAFEAALLRSIQKMDDNQQRVSVNTNKPSLDVRNKNNNARVSEEAGVDQTGEDRIQTLRSKKQTEKVTSPDIKAEIRLEKTNVRVPERPLSPPVCPRVQSVQSTPENKLRPPPLVRSHSMEDPQVERASYSKAPTTAQVKIAQNPVSRFGLKTFTVIPPKPAVSNSPKPAGSLRTGAIKIDELGNMVNQREVRPASAISVHPDETNSDPDSPLLCKAKAFWSSAKKQEPGPAPVPNQDISLKTIEAFEMPKSAPTTVILEVPPKPTEEYPKVTVPAPAVVDKPAPSDSVENSSVSFFKPSRRTSSQYVASAIAKYTVNPSTKADGIPAISETTTDGRTQLASRGVKHEIRSLHSVTNHKESNAFAERVSYFAGPKRSQSCPSQAVEKQTPIEELKLTGTSRGFKSLDSSPVINKPHQQTQSPTCSEPAQSPSKETTATKVSPGNSVSANRPTDSARPPVPKKPDIRSPGVLPEPHQVTVFGPVKKFKPVMLRSVEKESSLHSSLMEAIQSGEGIGQLRKVSDSRTSTLKKPSYVEAENEHSALLSAIRAHSNTARLKKTKSEAAVELEEFRKVEEGQSIQRDVTSPPPPPAFQPPPALNIPPSPPPPPPAPTAPAKPALVLPAGGNPELAREALLEAIRSGSGAERLRKVPIAKKTVKVNGRLGTIQASLPQKR